MATEILEKFRSAPPRGGRWKYTHPISGYEFFSPQIPALVDSIQKHEESNGYPVTAEKEIESQLCLNHPFSCGDGEPSFVERARNLAHSMVAWAESGFAVASKEVLSQRLAICEACPHWRGMRGGHLMTGRCNRCGCSGLKLQVGSSSCPVGKWSAVA